MNTKKGNAQKFSISYDGHFGAQSIYKNLQMLGPEEYLSTAKSMGLNVKDFGYRSYDPNIITRTELRSPPSMYVNMYSSLSLLNLQTDSI